MRYKSAIGMSAPVPTIFLLLLTGSIEHILPFGFYIWITNTGSQIITNTGQNIIFNKG